MFLRVFFLERIDDGYHVVAMDRSSFASLLSWWVQVSKFDISWPGSTLFSFGPPVAFVFLLCVLPVRQPEQDEASFRVRHDSRLDRFQLIIYRPVENKKRCVCTSRPSFRRTIVLPSSMLRWSHTCASVVHNCQWHLTCCLIDRSPCPSLVELEDIRETRLNNTSGPALCCLTNVKC